MAACGSGDAGNGLSGDGLLDCAAGEVVRGAGIDVAADSEKEVVATALAPWLESGADLVAFPPEELWSAVQDGRDVAVAYPELEGTGAWRVHDVRTCAEPETGPAAVDGMLDCAGDVRWTIQASLDPTVPGRPTPGAALVAGLAPYADRYSGEVVIDAGFGSLVVEGREQVVARPSEVPAGGWAVVTLGGCEGFEL